MLKATRQQTKNHNTRLVLKTVYDNENISRADVARLTQLTRPTVSSIVRDLLDEQLIVEIGLGPSGGGKPPTMLRVNANARHLIAVDLSERELRGAIVNLRGKVLEERVLSNPASSGAEALQRVYDLIDVLATSTTRPLLGIGVGSPGLISPQEGIVRHSINLGWRDLPLKQLLGERYDVPIYIANDSHTAGLAENAFGTPRPGNNLIVVKVGHGVSAGIVLNGQLFYGDGFGAGEIGHVVVDPTGPLCSCGNRGCLETFVSTRALLDQAAAILGTDTLQWDALHAALNQNSAALDEMVHHAGTRLGVALANLIAAFNIKHIVISGQVEQFGTTFLEAANSEARRCALPGMVAETKLSYSTLGRNIVLLGSSALVIKHELGII